jgi:GTP-binding protein HflX
MNVTGDLSGIRISQVQELKDLFEFKTERTELIHPVILEGLVRLTELWNREIAVYLSRSGLLISASVGHHASVSLPSIKGRSQSKHLRCIHTHPNGDFRLSSLDKSALVSLELESIASLGVRGGKLTGIQVAFNRDDQSLPIIVNLSSTNWQTFNYNELFSKKSEISQSNLVSNGKEKAFLIALGDENQGLHGGLSELCELTRAAGVDIVGQLVQSKRYGHSRSYLGSGKLQELVHRLQETKAGVVICDDELSPAQLRTLEVETGLKILDRTGLILDIFAQRALSREGKLQVELAQLKHLLPYLSGQGQALSRLGGGVGSRGPGETKLELDRRRVRERIFLLEKDLKLVLQQREVLRRQRTKSGLPIVALVGYTNAGKTTFMKCAMEYSGKDADVPQGENKLFATLDPIVRSIRIDSSSKILLSDTVGFIQKLPTKLLRAFLATLEEVRQADVLIHVLDASHPQVHVQAETVLTTLEQLGCDDKPLITLLNKVDKVSDKDQLRGLVHNSVRPVQISLTRGDSLKPVWKHLKTLLNQ